MDYKEFDRMVNEAEGTYTRSYKPSVSFPVLMRKVYTWMTLAMVITGITAYGVATSPGILQMLYSNSFVIWGLAIAEFALVIGLNAAINKLSLVTATLMFILFSILNGATLSTFFLAYTMQSIGTVFFITAGTFGVMALIGYTTKADLTSLGKMFMMALFGIIIAIVVNFFVGGSSFQFIISCLAVIIFVGLTAYDSQNIKQMLMNQDSASESAQKLALLGSLELYLDFINLFINLLRIFGNRD